MSTVGYCPQCDDVAALYEYKWPDDGAISVICQSCASDNDRDYLASNTCQSCGECFDDCLCPIMPTGGAA